MLCDCSVEVCGSVRAHLTASTDDNKSVIQVEESGTLPYNSYIVTVEYFVYRSYQPLYLITELNLFTVFKLISTLHIAHLY